MSQKVNNILIPNVSSIPSQGKVDSSNKIKEGQGSEFKALLEENIGNVDRDHGIKLSMHAARRLSERDLSMDGSEFMKLKSAMDKLKTKGGQDSLVITDKAAYIVDVKNNTIVTAIDKGSIAENVFTKIDSTIFC